MVAKNTLHWLIPVWRVSRPQELHREFFANLEGKVAPPGTSGPELGAPVRVGAVLTTSPCSARQESSGSARAAARPDMPPRPGRGGPGPSLLYSSAVYSSSV